MMESKTPTDTCSYTYDFSQLQQFALYSLPVLNDAIVSRRGCVYQILQQCRDPLSELIKNVNVDRIEKKITFETLRCIAPIVSSIQRHLVTYNYPEQHFSQLLNPGIEEFLLALGTKAGIPPRDSIYTTWLDNQNPIYPFDTNPGWLFFHKAVKMTSRNSQAAYDSINDVTNSVEGIYSSKIFEALEFAISTSSQTFEFYKGFVKGGMNADYFANVFRTYFLKYTICNKIYYGSNATNIPSIPALDFKLGLIDDRYEKIVRDRFEYMKSEDAKIVESAIKEPSLLQLIVEHLGFEFHHFKHTPIHILMQEIHRGFITPHIKNVIRKFNELVQILASWSKQHFGLINSFLIKQEKKGSSCPMGYDVPAVDFAHGVGGATHEETKSIRDMRSNNPLLFKINQLIF